MTNWRKEFAPFNSNAQTARILLQKERDEPGYLTANERQFVTDVLGLDAFEEQA